MSFPRYPQYKDSGVDWLGPVPAHWEVKPLWTFFRRVKRVGFEGEQLLSVYRDHGVVPKASRDDNFNKPSDDLSVYQLVVPGDLAINKMKAWQGSVAISEHRGIVSPAYFVYEALHSECSKFLHYLMRSPRYIAGYLSLSKGIRVNQWDLEPQLHSRVPLALPPLPEQRQIAGFLDRETGKIDALVAEQERLLELLKEKRQAVISHAVTRGLPSTGSGQDNPNAPLKPSGLDWLGDVPAHWTVASVRRLVRRIEQGWSPECFGRPAEPDEWGVVKTGCVNRGTYVEDENKALPETLDPLPEYEIHVGDVLMSRASGSPELVGSTALIKATRPKLMLSDKIFRIYTEDHVEPAYFVWLFNSAELRSQIEQSISGADGLANNLPQSALKGFYCTLPPLAEQRAIVAHLDAATAQFDALTAAVERALALLQERRTALISAAVTGQIDVRSAAC